LRIAPRSLRAEGRADFAQRSRGTKSRYFASGFKPQRLALNIYFNTRLHTHYDAISSSTLNRPILFL
jgi:hypothetical protein